MKVHVRVDMDDSMRGSIRAGAGRYGKATRKEAREFVEVAFRAAVRALPPPKQRAPKRKDVERRTFALPNTDTPEAARGQRNRIARLYGHREVMA